MVLFHSAYYAKYLLTNSSFMRVLLLSRAITHGDHERGSLTTTNHQRRPRPRGALDGAAGGLSRVCHHHPRKLSRAEQLTAFELSDIGISLTHSKFKHSSLTPMEQGTAADLEEVVAVSDRRIRFLPFFRHARYWFLLPSCPH